METNPYQTPVEQQALPSSHSVYGPYRDTRGLAKTVTGFLIVDIAISIIVSATSFRYASLLDTGDWEKIDGFEGAYTGSVSLQLLVFIVTAVFFSIWINRSMKNAWAMEPRQRLMTPGWAVGWYFIPIANLWKPLEAMKQIRDMAFGSSAGLNLAPWWAFWLITSFGGNISARLPTDTLEDLQSSLMFDVYLSLLEVVSAVFALILVRKITAKQYEVGNSQPQLVNI